MNEGNLVILAGGISSRMKREGSRSLDPSLSSQADTVPKAMIGVGPGGRPLMDYLLSNAERAGYRDIVIVISERDTAIRTYYGDKDRENQFKSLVLSYAVQRIPEGRVKPLGTADALLQGLLVRPDWKGQQCTVCNSDNLYSSDAMNLLRQTRADCAMIDYDRDGLLFPRERVAQFAVLVKGPGGRLSSIIEKPSPEDFERARDAAGRIGVSMNIWRFQTETIFPFLEKVPLNPSRMEKEIPSAVMLMIASGASSLQTIPLREHVPDLTGRDDIEQLRAYLEREYPETSL
jgi:NDP-sugar pyrophosphorylase family protein